MLISKGLWNRRIWALAPLLLLCSCEKIDSLFEPSPRFERCSPAYSLYEGEQHFIHRDFVTEDGIMNQRKWWLEASLPENSPCDPLAVKKKPSLPKAAGQ